MMGRQAGDQGRLFYSFNLEESIPASHLLRRMNTYVTSALADVHRELADYYSHTGRPSIDPELMLRMLIVKLADQSKRKEGMHKYGASKTDCDARAFKARCCPKEPMRKVPRSIHEKARAYARSPGACLSASAATTPDGPLPERQDRQLTNYRRTAPRSAR